MSLDTARFFAKTKRDSASGCLNWTGAVSSSGYGTVTVGSATRQSHRVAWSLVNGPIPTGFEPDHLCRNPRCVDAAHLELVTEAVNTWRAKGFRWADTYQVPLLRVMTHPTALVTRAESRLLLGLSEPAVRRAIHTGELRESGSYRAGRHRAAALIHRSDLVAFVFNRAVEDSGLPVLEALIAQQKQGAAA